MIVMGIPPLKTVMDFANLGILILLIVIFFVALFMLLFVVFNWIIVNIVRKFKHKNKQLAFLENIPQSKMITKLDIHLETDDDKLINSIRNLSDIISKKDNGEQ